MGLAVEVKDSARNPDKWAYYGFDADGKTADCHAEKVMGAGHATTPTPRSNIRSYSFNPMLKPVAKKFGTYNEAREHVTDAK